MLSMVFYFLLAISLANSVTACDSDLIERGKRYVERVRLGAIDHFTSKVSEGREEISIVTLLPESNYSGNKDPQDAAQLVDGKLARPPVWTRKDSVGWFGHTPVIIEAQRYIDKPTSGKVRVRAGLGKYAGIDLPRQIDIYSNIDGGLTWVGSYKERGGLNLEDKRSYWLEAQVRNVRSRLVIAIHANGAYVQLDEVEFVPGPSDNSVSMQESPDGKPLLLTLEEVKADASHQLRLNMEMESSNRNHSKQQWRNKFGSDKMLSWIADPWHPSLDTLGADEVVPAQKILQINGTDSEYEQFAIGFYNTGSTVSEVGFDIEGLSQDQYQLSLLGRVLSADGNIAFDPLIPINKRQISVMPGWPTLLWVKVDLRKLGLGRKEATLYVHDSKTPAKSKAFTIKFNIQDSKKLKALTLQTKVWGYSSDQPIWKNPQKAIEDQQAHYVNSWTIHSSNLPGKRLDGKVETDKLQRLNRDLALYAGRGLVRLYFGWTAQNNPLGLSKDNYTMAPGVKKRFSVWLLNLKSWMQKAGYKDQDWQLYPLDEPSGSDLLVLKSIARFSKKILPNVGIYTDPVSTHSNPTDLESLQTLAGSIDSWQPGLEFARGSGAEFFQNLQQPWGFYHNPTTPAKRASAIADYRSQGWWAWTLGASSIGFWSYSDSTGSSVWDDFDGRRPDFAVVYEKSDQLLSSRRWEAFAEGVEDYKLLMGSRIRVPDGIHIEQLDTQMINMHRKLALDQIR